MSNLVLNIILFVVIASGVLFAVQLIAFRILRIILRFLIVVALLVAVLVRLQPDTFQVSRSQVIAAPPAKIFAQVNDFRNWAAWSPWAKIDPQSKTSFEGAPAGPGAIMRWSGNNEVGEGSQTITESVRDQKVKMRLDFVRPMKGTSDVEFALTPENNGTRVTWTMSGTNDFIAKAVGLFMNCDQMVGSQFEQGLSNLATAVGAPAQ